MSETNNSTKPQPISLKDADLSIDDKECTEKELREKEENYVHQVYQTIAPHFSSTRYKPWPVVRSFLESMPPGSIGADVGCGNGKYLGVNPSIFVLGSDRCSNLIDICIERGHEALVADNHFLPYRSNVFDFVISIAVIHHFTTENRRIQAIKELSRILKPGGRMLLYVWALEQKSKRNFDPNTPDVLVPWVLPQTFSKDSNSNDIAAEPQVFQRYYHLFQEGEIEDLASKAAPLNLVDHGYDRDNWWTDFRKKE